MKDVKLFLDDRAVKHKNYFHYTTVTTLKNMLTSKKLHLSLGRTMNDLLEIQKISPEKWNRLYVASFSYSANESVALWHIYGNPLDKAIRIQFSQSSVLKILENLINNSKCKSVADGKEYKIKKATLVDIAYLQNNQKSLKWNKALLKESCCNDLSVINHHEELAGYIKNIAWEYELETRFLIELDYEEMNNYPEKIEIDAEDLWKDAKILCGPCLPADMLKGQLEVFLKENHEAIKLNVDNITDSILLNRVHFRSICEKCQADIECNFKSERRGNNA